MAIMWTIPKQTDGKPSKYMTNGRLWFGTQGCESQIWISRQCVMCALTMNMHIPVLHWVLINFI